MKQLIITCIFACCSFLTTGQISLSLETIAQGFSQPVDIASAGDERLFIVEKDGVIKILNPDGTVNDAPFLDIDDRVRTNGAFSGESGLLGLAFHPDYANNGYFYVNYVKDNVDPAQTIIARYSVSSNNPDVADKESEKIILVVDQPDTAHNGGDMSFNPKDGTLYTGLGDGGFGDDPLGIGQDRQTLLGKMLRIDVDNGDPYSVPANNPFVNDDQTLDEIWALGLRNPWRFSFDRLTGDLWIGDVGQQDREEIDFQAADSPGGENYGWKCYEGNKFNPIGECGEIDINDYQFPIWDYESELPFGCSINGGFVYRGTKYPLLYGLYLYSDYCSGKIWSLQQDAEGQWINEELYAGPEFSFVTMGEDQNGELLIANLMTGGIARIVDATTTPTTESLSTTGIKVSPNPFHNQLILETELKESGQYRLQLLNAQGKRVWEESSFLDRVVSKTISTQNLPNGIYFFVLERNGQQNTIRVVKQ